MTSILEVGVFPWLALAVVVIGWRVNPSGRRALVVRLASSAALIAVILYVGTRAFGAPPPLGRVAMITGLQLSLIVPVVAAAELATRLFRGRLGRLPPKLAEAIATVVGQGGVFALAFPALLLSLGLRRANSSADLPAYALGRPVQGTEFEGHGGTRLRGAWIHAPERRGVVLLVHGLAADGMMFVPALEPLAKRGFDVFTFDQRGHGASGGHTSTLGAREQFDVLAAWNEVTRATRGERIPRLAVGISLGGAALQLASPELEGLDGMLLDSTFARSSAPAKRHVPLPGPLAELAFQLARITAIPLLGTAVLDVSPIDAASRSRPNLPVGIVHARGDGLVPYAEALALKDAYGERARLFTVEAATHPATFEAGRLYGQALDDLADRATAK